MKLVDFINVYSKELSKERDSSFKNNIIQIVAMNRLRNYRATSNGFIDEVFSNENRNKRLRKLCGLS